MDNKMDRLKVYHTAYRIAFTRILKQFPLLPRPNSFRAYYEHPSIEVDCNNRTIKVTANLYASDDAPATAIQNDLNQFITAITQGDIFPSELAPFTVDKSSLAVSVSKLNQICQDTLEAVGDNYCDCEGFSVHYTHEIIFKITDDEAEKILYENIKDKII